jgi:hypothetical protein
MSIFTNPASAAVEAGVAYSTAVLELLGARDPMAVLAATPLWCRDAIAGLDQNQLTRRETQDKWAINEILEHLADSELVWGYRVRRVLAEDRPVLKGYDQDLWADRLDYASSEPSNSLHMFRVLRESHLRLLNRASDADLDRVGVHEERGDESLRHMVRLYAGHDLLHRLQISRVRGLVESDG